MLSIDITVKTQHISLTFYRLISIFSCLICICSVCFDHILHNCRWFSYCFRSSRRQHSLLSTDKCSWSTGICCLLDTV